MALGAYRGRIMRLVVGEGLLMASAGIVLGAMGAVAAAWTLKKDVIRDRSSRSSYDDRGSPFANSLRRCCMLPARAPRRCVGNLKKSRKPNLLRLPTPSTSLRAGPGASDLKQKNARLEIQDGPGERKLPKASITFLQRVPHYSAAHTTTPPTLQRRAHCFYFGVLLKHLMTHLASPAGLLISAEGHGCVEDVVAVNPDSACPQLRCKPVSFLDVPCPDASS